MGNTYLFLLATRISPASPNFGQAKQGQKFVVPTFHIHFLNPECVTIPWVLAPKNFPIENFRVRSDLQKISLFHEIPSPLAFFFCRPAADSILMPPTFHIARLNRYTPNFSGVPQKLTWCQQFGLQIFQRLGDPGLHESLQPCSRAARKWRENEEMKRKWRENEEIERKWRENEEMERE